MFARRMVLSAVAVVALASAAQARVAGSHDVEGERPRPAGIQLAQMGEVDIYYDEYGRRVLVDRFTGEVVAVESRRLTRQEWRQMQRERARERQRRAIEEEPLYEDGVVVLESPSLRPRRWEFEENERFVPEDDFSAYPEERTDEFPEAPKSEERMVRQEPIERKPLDDASPKSGAEVETPGTDQPKTAAVDAGGGAGATATAPAANGSIEPTPSFASRPEVAALQVLLDRKGASPGVIDGRFGSNVDKALAAYREITGDNLKSTDAEGIRQRLMESGGEAFADYQITAEDAAGPYVASVPEDYGEKAKLERLSFTSVTEMLAERFHMDEAYLKALNPEANFNRPGTIVKVANFGQLVATPVARIVADKGKKQVRAYDQAGKLVAAYPATIGSADTPSPIGNHAVSRIAFDPNYTYNPKVNFKQGDNDKVLTIPPGPNGPVGSIWIALDKPTYGIHGTPEPSKIGKTESHGCVRLTNWDASELAKLVKAGVMVEFVE